MDDKILRDLFDSVKTIAVVGLSNNQQRAAYGVAKYLQGAGYKIVPINPGCEEVMGEKCYPSLEEVPFPIDLVDVFRRGEFVPPIAEAAVKIGAKGLWLQDEVISPEAEKMAADAGMFFHQNDCIFRQRKRLYESISTDSTDSCPVFLGD